MGDATESMQQEGGLSETMPDTLVQDMCGEFSPLKDLDELLSWKPAQDYVSRELYVPYDKLPKLRVEGLQSDGEKILCCHDMQGGYLEDRYVLGGRDPHGYVFRHWHAIDGFVYFSHHFVTIPPPGWTNAAHKHGCPILGTVITEWDEGRRICQEMLSSRSKMERCVQQLVNIALYYRFDGWILNIENALEKDEVSMMLEFVSLLTSAMHTAIPHSHVIWYDAVTIEGRLDWQNSLTKLNRPFFERCDGIWINYTWKEGDPNRIRDAAGERRGDVFLGVDCFGRGTYGGGGMNTFVGVEAVKNAGMNVALFGCAWPYQHYTDTTQGVAQSADSEDGPLSSVYREWYDFDDEFWYRLDKVWNRRRQTIMTLPFSTDFSIGSGSAYYSAGHMCDASGSPWYNLSLQSLQSTPWIYDSLHTNVMTCFVTKGTAYNRSNCFVIKGGVGEPTRIRLFQSYIGLAGKHGISLRCTSALSKGISLRIVLKVSRNVNTSDKKETIMLELDCIGDRSTLSFQDSQPSFSSTALVKHPSKQSKNGQICLNTSEKDADDIKPLEGQPWISCEFGIPAPDIPAWVFEDGYITNIDAIIRPLTSGSMCKCHAAIGNISMWFMNEPFPQCSPVGPIIPENVDLRFILDDSENPVGKEITLSLVWESERVIRRFQVWMKTATQKPGNDNLVWGDAKYLSTVTAPIYIVRNQRMDLDVVAVRFFVLTEVGDKAQPVRSGTSVTLTFPEVNDQEVPGANETRP